MTAHRDPAQQRAELQVNLVAYRDRLIDAVDAQLRESRALLDLLARHGVPTQHLVDTVAKIDQVLAIVDDARRRLHTSNGPPRPDANT